MDPGHRHRATGDRLGDAASLARLATRLAVDHAAEELGGFDGLMDAAGVLRGGPIATTDPKASRELFDVNLLGLLHATQATVHVLASRPGVVHPGTHVDCPCGGWEQRHRIEGSRTWVPTRPRARAAVVATRRRRQRC